MVSFEAIADFIDLPYFSRSGSKLFAKVISRQQKSPLVSKEISTKQLVNTTFWLKPWLKLILFGSVFPDLAKVLAKTNSEPYNISISLIRHFSSYLKKNLFLED